MTKQYTWQGKSGRRYTYSVYDIDRIPNADVEGNYIFAKVVRNRWVPVYIGEGILQDRRSAAIRDDCVVRNGSTHFHVHLNPNRPDRLHEQDDLIDSHPECQYPVGCNGQPSD